MTVRYPKLKPVNAEQRDVATWAEKVPVQDILNLVRQKGIEECSEIIRFLPSDKLRAVIDLDVWKNRAGHKKGRAEKFNAEKFLHWMQALLSTGADEAVDSLRDLGVEFTAGALGHYLDLVPIDVYAMNRAESGLATEDKNVEHGNPLELGIYGSCYVQLKKDLCLEDVSEIILELLGACEQHDPDFLAGVFFTVTRQADGDVVTEDFQSERDQRLEQAGYVPAQKAYEYLLRFRTEWGLDRFARTQKAEWPKQEWMSFLLENFTGRRQPDSRRRDSLLDVERCTNQRVSNNTETDLSMALIKEPTPHHQSSTHKRDPDHAREKVSLLISWAHSLPSPHARSFQTQWIFLANILATGWEHQGALLGPKRAMEVLENVIALGLTICATREADAKTCRFWTGNENVFSVCSLFEVGWHYLLEKVTIAAAHQLDTRLRLRHRSNCELREAWYAACLKRRQTEGCSIARWCLEGRYRMVNEILSDLEFALPAEATLGLRILLDSTPGLPDGLGTLHASLPGYRPRVHVGRKLLPKTRWLSRPGEESPYLFELHNLLTQFDKDDE